MGVLVSSWLFPGSSLHKLIFLEDSLWGISWLLIARQSFLSHRSGYPPRAMSITLAVELYLMVHYTFIRPWPFHPLLIVNYIVWPATSLFNLAAVMLYSREELAPDGSIKKCALRVGLEMIGYAFLFAFAARSLPPHLVMAYLGQSVIFIISIHFFVRILQQEDLTGMSLSGNIVRLIAGLLCFYVNFVLRRQELSSQPVLLIMMALSVFVDLGFLSVYLRKLRRSA